ncbi:hypothetical protein PIB30_113221, partial [Stylosanthes scabra]|nr:hypothetical protein [Stylosanthes scabra]
MGFLPSSLDIQSWIIQGMKHNPFLFSSTLWWIWRCRNNAIFNQEEHWIPSKVHALIKFSETELHKFFSMNQSFSSTLVTPDWIPLAAESVKLNCDASKMHNGDIVGFGCAIRDNNGDWQRGCAGTI